MEHTRKLISLVCLFLATVSVRAETQDCTPITSLPYDINSQGIYCFTGHLSTLMTTGFAINIHVNNVTIDMNGYKLGGLGTGDGTNTVGIFAYDRKNITIKNGIIRGFLIGIQLFDSGPTFTNSSGHVIEHILADGNTSNGFSIGGFGNTISHNTVVDTGGSTVDPFTSGIFVYGDSANIQYNNVSFTTGTSGNAEGITVGDSNYSVVENNNVTNTASPGGTGIAIGINNSAGVFLRNNNLANADYGISFGSATGKYLNNLTFDVTTPFTGGTAIGNNNN